VPTSSLTKDDILKKIASMGNLPSPNPVAVDIVRLLSDENVKIYHVVEEIEKDQVLVAKILKLINSGFYALRNSVDTIERAVTLLGILNIKQIVYSAAVMDVYKDVDKEEWNHSYSSFVLIGNLIKEKDIQVNNNLALAMLMHDIGKVVLRSLNTKLYRQLQDIKDKYSISSAEAEEKVYKVNHAEVGALLFEKWEMVPSIIIPVKNHHMYNEIPEEYVLETALLQLVDWIDCSARGITNIPEPSKELLKEANLDNLDLDYWITFQEDLIEILEDED
jgi:HD-like signal output (HDOD) protein